MNWLFIYLFIYDYMYLIDLTNSYNTIFNIYKYIFIKNYS